MGLGEGVFASPFSNFPHFSCLERFYRGVGHIDPPSGGRVKIGIKSQKIDVLTQNLVPERFSGRENRFWPRILIIFKFP